MFNITSINPIASNGRSLITINGNGFTLCDNMTLSLNSNELDILSIQNNIITFAINGNANVNQSEPNCSSELDCGVFDLVLSNDCHTETKQIIRYKTEQEVSKSIGNNKCYTKPKISLNTLGDSNYGMFMNWTPNVNTIYVQVITKTLYNIDINSITLPYKLNDMDLIDGDLIFVSNQTNIAENGIYTISETGLSIYLPYSDNLFIDLGVRIYDDIDGDITRNVITNINTDFTKPNLGTITYNVLNSQCILSTINRKIRVLLPNASISPVNTFIITDYKILNKFDECLIKPIDNYNICNTSGGIAMIGPQGPQGAQGAQGEIGRGIAINGFVTNETLLHINGTY